MKNQGVLSRLSERVEFKAMPESLREAFSSIPVGKSENEITTIFDNVNDMYETLKIILKGKYSAKIEDFKVLLVTYIKTGKVTYFESVNQLLERIVPNKVVLKLLSERSESKDLPESLIAAFLSIPEEFTGDDPAYKNPKMVITEIFKKVTTAYNSTKNILQGHGDQIGDIIDLLVAYVKTRQERFLTEANEQSRVFGEVNSENEEKRREYNQLKILAENKEKQLKEELDSLAVKYASISEKVEDADKRSYKQFVEQKDLKEIRSLVTRIQGRIERQNLLIQNFIPAVKGFLKSGEGTIVYDAIGSYNSSNLERAGKIVDELWERQKDWKQRSEAEFSGLREEYAKFFAPEAVEQEKINFEEALNTNNPFKMQVFFEKISTKIQEEKDLRTAFSLEINALKDLEFNIKSSMDFSTILADISTIKGKAEDVLRVPELKEDEIIIQLFSDISNLENEVKEVDKEYTNIAKTFGQTIPLTKVSLELKKTELETLLEEVQKKKQSHAEVLANLSNELQKNIDFAVSAVKAQFNSKKQTVNNTLEKCMKTVERQRKRAEMVGHHINDRDKDKHKEIEKKIEEVKNKIGDAQEYVSKITVNEADSAKSVSDKILEIDHKQNKTADFIKETDINQAALNEISGPYNKAMCFNCIKEILTVLIAKTQERMNAYQGTVVKKTISKKAQAGLMLERMNLLLNNAKNGNVVDLTENNEELRKEKQVFSAIASKVSFWAFLPGTHGLSYTVNDQNYNKDLDVGIAQIDGLLREVSELNKTSLKGG